MSTRRQPACCPHCGKETDADTPATGTDASPAPGDVSVCFYCAGIAFFTEDGLRLPSADERAQLLEDPDVAAAVGAVLAYRGVER